MPRTRSSAAPTSPTSDGNRRAFFLFLRDAGVNPASTLPMIALCLGLLLLQGEPSPEAIRRWIDDLNVESVEARNTAMRRLIEAGESARSAVQALAASPD